MQKTDKQLQEILKRAEGIKERKRIQRQLVTELSSAGVCLVLMVVTVCFLPAITEAGTSMTEIHFGSLILQPSFLGYALIGILTFIFGILVTMSCLSWKSLKDKERE